MRLSSKLMLLAELSRIRANTIEATVELWKTKVNGESDAMMVDAIATELSELDNACREAIYRLEKNLLNTEEKITHSLSRELGSQRVLSLANSSVGNAYNSLRLARGMKPSDEKLIGEVFQWAGSSAKRAKERVKLIVSEELKKIREKKPKGVEN